MIESAVQPVTNESGEVIPAAAVRPSSWRSFILQVIGIALFLFSLLVAHALYQTGSVQMVWPYFCGQRLLFDTTSLDLGKLSAGTVVERELSVCNVSSSELTLLGSQKSCGCIALEEFPIVIPAATERKVRLKIGLPRGPGSFLHTIKFFTDDKPKSTVVVTVSGTAR